MQTIYCRASSAISLAKFRHAAFLTAALITVCSGAISGAWAHPAPEENDDDSSRTYHIYHNWNNWNSDWDRRWRRNWDNSWAPYDNDPVVRRTYVNNKYVQAQQPVQTQPVEGEIRQWASIPNPGNAIPNFHEVYPFLFRGGQPSEEGLEKLANMGVRTIVNLRSDPQQTESERQLCEHHNLKYINIPLTKSAAPSNQDVSRFMDVIGSARENPDRGAIFVHDHLGADRTGCMVAMYRQLADKYPFDRAYGEMLKYGFHPNYIKLKQAVQKLDPNAKAASSNTNRPVARSAAKSPLRKPVAHK